MHFSPILFLIAPLVIVTHSVWSMIAVQAVAGALVAPPLFLIARKRVWPWLAAGCAICALLYPPLAGVTFTDFHEAGLEPAAIVWLIWAIDAGKTRAALVLAAIALGIKEDVAPGLAFGGVAAALWYRRFGDSSRAALVLSIASIAAFTFALYFAVLRPLLAGGVPYGSLHFYDYHAHGSTPAGYVSLWDAQKMQYLESILLPLLFVPLLSPAFVLALPGLAEVLGSHEAITLALETHYAAVWLGYVLVAFVAGAVLMYRRSRWLATGVVVAAASLCFYTLIWVDPIHRWYFLYRLPDAHDAALTAQLQRLPPDAAVSVPPAIFAHLGFDPHATLKLSGR